MSKKNIAAGCLFGVGLLGSAAAALYAYKVRPMMHRWGADDDEVGAALPGDDLLPDAKLRMTHAVTIGAPPEEVWPWLVQIGQGRGGFYSYEWIENSMGAEIQNADSILPEFQQLEPGDTIPLAEDGPALPVAQVEAPHTLVLYGDTRDDPAAGEAFGFEEGDYLATVWAFTLEDGADGTTRLVERWLADWNPSPKNFVFYRLFLEPGAFIMERGMLLGLKRRAEGAVSRPAPEPAYAT